LTVPPRVTPMIGYVEAVGGLGRKGGYPHPPRERQDTRNPERPSLCVSFQTTRSRHLGVTEYWPVDVPSVLHLLVLFEFKVAGHRSRETVSELSERDEGEECKFDLRETRPFMFPGGDYSIISE
jgi:hypothetical protein